MKKILAVFLSLFLVIPQLTAIGQEKKVRYLEAIFSVDQIQVSSDIVYKTVEKPDSTHIDLTLDVFTPMEDEITKRPLLVWIHGGGFVGGSKKTMEKRCVEFAQFGYVTCTINYRLMQDLPYPFTMDTVIEAAVDDARSAIDWLLQNAATYGINEEIIFVGGSSAGAITSCHVAYDDRDWSHKENLKGIISLWGGLLPFHSEDLKIGTISYEVEVDEEECSPCIIHGALDPIVPVSMAYTLEGKCVDVGIPCTMKIDPNAKHGVPSDIGTSYHSIEPVFLFICMQ
jgi:acetyl esterase/lipase